MVEFIRLPERWSTGQRLKNSAFYYLVRWLWPVLRATPRRLAPGLSTCLGTLAYLVARAGARRAQTHLRSAFPEWDERRIARTARSMCVHLARSVFEFADLERSVEECLDSSRSREALDTLNEAMALGRGAIVVTGHIGNWELLAQSFSKAGYPTFCIAKPIYDPRFTRWIDQLRAIYGMRTLWRGDQGGYREIRRVFRNKGVLGILIDQDTRVAGDFVPFFGRPAFTPTAAATLHRRIGAPLLVGFHHRTPDGHVLTMKRFHASVPTSHPAFDRIATAELTWELESAIRRHPEQWVWVHRRWRTRPRVEPAAPTADESP